jgi:hypothetical protein
VTRSRRSSTLTSGRSKALAGLVTAGTAIALVAGPAAAASQHAAHSQVKFYRSKLTAAQIKAYSKDADNHVVVLLRKQYRNELSGGNHALATRAQKLKAAQHPFLAELRSLHATGIKHYRFINAVAATVSSAEVAHLRANPAVKAVVTDRKVAITPATATTSSSASKSGSPSDSDPVNTTPHICGTANKPLVQPEGLHYIHALDAGATGRGVKVAVFPDGLDPNIKDFIRPNGTHAIFDYQDFTGQGPNSQTGAGEAFGDASSIISQGRETFDLSKEVNPSLPLPSPCDIKIKGVAPDAQLAVMKVFGTNDSFDSTILQGMDWAVFHDHVNVLSQSFGGNPIGDPGTDPISVFDSEAVAHGISVVASSGDAGITNTIGDPASLSKGIISVGATTDFQSNAQLSEHGYQLGGFQGWESNNISPFSSGGFTEFGPNTVDVVGPGDSNWADCSRKIIRYEECADSFGAPLATAPPIEDFGGTSESCPLTAGVVALVIQAYKQSHGGTAPSAVVVKRIITSSATNLGEPADEQGAGQVNAKAAVALARSYQGPGLTGTPSGNALSIAPSKIKTTDEPGSAHSATVTVTNQGANSQSVAPVVQRFGAPTTIVNNTLNYDPNDPNTPTFLYWLTGLPEPYVSQTFNVPAGYQRLNARLAYPASETDGSQTVSEVLFDPSGKLAQDSDPQGAPLGFSQVEVRNPAPGTWTAIYFSRPASDKYSGPITTAVTLQKLVNGGGSVTPSSATIPAGGSQAFTVHYSTPASPGDAAASVNFGDNTGIVPLLTRSLVDPTVANPGTFSTQITGGNGRMSFPGQDIPYQFTVPAGVKDVDIDVNVADPGYRVIGTLLDPKNSPVDVQDSTFVDLTTTNSDGSNPSTEDQTLHLSWRNPMAGTWLLDLGTFLGASSGKTNSTISGTISFNTVQTSSVGVPDDPSTMLAPDVPTVADVTVTNTGNSPEIYYVDPRETSETDYPLAFVTSPSGSLPVTATATSQGGPLYLVPPGSTSLTAVANATGRVDFTTNPAFGAPEISSTTGKTAVASYSANDIAASEWDCPPTLIGPFSGPASGSFTCAAFAVTRTINDDISSLGGNIWDNATDVNSPNVFDPTQSVVVQPGDSTTIPVTITPTDAEDGATISGYLSVQTYDPNTVGSDDLVHIPYSYTVGTPDTSAHK